MLIIKEKLDLPPVVIEFSNHYWTDSQSIGKEYELLLALFVQPDSGGKRRFHFIGLKSL